MRLTARISLATAFALAICLVASPSFATNTREAIKACDSNPACKFDVGHDGVVISVGGKLIVCPIKNGPCGVTRTVHTMSLASPMTCSMQRTEARDPRSFGAPLAS